MAETADDELTGMDLRWAGSIVRGYIVQNQASLTVKRIDDLAELATKLTHNGLRQSD